MKNNMAKHERKFWVAFAFVTMSAVAVVSKVTIAQTSTSNNIKFQSRTCDFSKPVSLRRTTRYGIFGNDEFDTIVCGYMVTRVEERFGNKANIAYFRIIKFADSGFRAAIEKGVTSNNRVNFVKKGVYDFSLGCFKEGVIEGTSYKGEVYMSSEVQRKIISSSANKPVSIILSFGKHEGSDCVCCNLAHRIRLY